MQSGVDRHDLGIVQRRNGHVASDDDVRGQKFGARFAADDVGGDDAAKGQRGLFPFGWFFIRCGRGDLARQIGIDGALLIRRDGQIVLRLQRHVVDKGRDFALHIVQHDHQPDRSAAAAPCGHRGLAGDGCSVAGGNLDAAGHVTNQASCVILDLSCGRGLDAVAGQHDANTCRRAGRRRRGIDSRVNQCAPAFRLDIRATRQHADSAACGKGNVPHPGNGVDARAGPD